MNKRLNDIYCVFRIHLARLRREAGPFLLAALVFPAGMYLFAGAVARQTEAVVSPALGRRFLAASMVFSLSLTAISWLGYLLLENRFTGRLKLFATLPVAPSSYVFGILIFALLQGALGTVSLLAAARFFGAPAAPDGLTGVAALMLVVIVSILALCGISVIVAARVRSFSEGSLYTDALGAGIVLLAPVYYPAESMPAVLRPLGWVLPTVYIDSALDKILAGNPAVFGELAVLAAMAVVLLGAGFRLLDWREE
ncbi:MAG: ABC transporter permease [Acidobacteria bacterium]|nr:ABC transporter permease [Acidobacteriota bacterium]